MNTHPDFPSKACLPHIIPQPAKMTLGQEYVDLSEFKLDAPDSPPAIKKLFLNTFPLREDGEKTLKLIKNDQLKPESYTADIAADHISVSASDDRGFFYAFQTMRQLTYGGHITAATIEDQPKLGIRGSHFNLGTVKMLDFDDLKQIIKMLAKFKMNTLVLEYTDRFPFEKHPAIPSPAAFTKEQTLELEQLATENYIDVIPLVQSLGHMRHVLRHPEYHHLLECELPVDRKSNEQFCPLTTGSLELFQALALEVMKVHPNSRYLHVGADESRCLGICPKCAEFVKQHGKNKLYIDYLNKVCKWVKSQGRIPILWDDMLSHNPETVDTLDKDAVIMYWDYWTTTEKSPILVARGAGYGVVSDKRWRTEWASELEEPQRTIVNNFSRGIDLANDLGDNYMENFGQYLGPDFPKYMSAFPNLGFLADKGFQVIGGPTTLGNRIDETFGLPNFNRFLGNIREFSAACIRHQALGLVTTAWYNFPPEILPFGIMVTAQSTWSGVASS